jgi:hypothetical protein
VMIQHFCPCNTWAQLEVCAANALPQLSPLFKPYFLSSTFF